MPTILTEADEFTADITVPEGGDQRTAASVESPFQKLANRTRYLKNLINPASVARTITLPLSAGQSDAAIGVDSGIPGWKLTRSISPDTFSWTTASNNYLFCPLKYAQGTIITRARMLANLSASGTITMKIMQATPDIANVGAGIAYSTLATQSFTGSGNTVIACSALSIAVDNDDKDLWMELRGAIGVTTRVSGWDVDIIDVGPRNF